MVGAGEEHVEGFGPFDGCEDAIEDGGDGVGGCDVGGKEVGEGNGVEVCGGVDSGVGEVDGVSEGCVQFV